MGSCTVKMHNIDTEIVSLFQQLPVKIGGTLSEAFDRAVVALEHEIASQGPDDVDLTEHWEKVDRTVVGPDWVARYGDSHRQNGGDV